MKKYIEKLKCIGCQPKSALLSVGFLCVSSIGVAQCDSAIYKPKCDPMMPMPTIYLIGNEVAEELKMSSTKKYNGNDCRYEIVRVNIKYIDYLVDFACKNGNYGKQPFMVVNTLQEAYDIVAWCKPFIPYEIKACDN